MHPALLLSQLLARAKFCQGFMDGEVKAKEEKQDKKKDENKNFDKKYRGERQEEPR